MNKGFHGRSRGAATFIGGAVSMTLAFALAGGLSVPTTVAAVPAALPADADIRQILVDRVDVERRSLGIVVGIVTPAGRRVIAYGHPRQGDMRPVDGDSVFEIGSITKVFTSLLLADMAQRGELSLHDPLAKHLPEGMRVPSRNGRTITLVDLATNTTGLPFWPANFPPVSNTVAFKDYSIEQLAEFLAVFELPRDVGAQWEYSNMNGGLLGLALAHRLGTDYEGAVSLRIARALGMPSTAITLSPDLSSRLASGHNARLEPAPAWNVPLFAGAGSLRSTASDLLTLLEHAMGERGTALAPAFAAMLETRRPGLGFEQALGWMILAFPQAEGLITHDGGTSGYASSIAYDPSTRTGVVVLSNSAASVSDMARHLLRPALPLTKSGAPRERTEIAVDTTLFDLYVGQYTLAPAALVTVARENDTLTIQLPSAPKLRLRAETERDFFIAESPQTTFTFEADASGNIVRLLLQAPTGNLQAERAGMAR